MENSVWIATLAAAITAGTPILYAALGEILAERAGVLNLGVEGMMLVGAVTGFMVAVRTGNPWLGFFVALLAAGLMAAVFAFLTITLRANQVVTGLALTIFGTGLSGFLGKPYVGVPLPLSFKPAAVPILADIPIIGPVFFNHDPLVYLTYILVPLLWYYFYRTRPGLNLRAIGENPAAADALGVNVFALRYIYVIIGGMLAGAGGAFLSLAYAPSWLENMTAGRGWIAVALVIFAVWDPVKALLGSYLFGGVDALTYTLQAATKIAIPSFFLKMLPYILTLVVLIIATRQTLVKHIGAPGALAIPYDREER
ncbi:ABC transporter permease [Moorella sp. E308F]|jgi:simple sugar transport system permease protein|uniref:ABC transporter permease n=1 Tax=unclassified Neomoorella TaxID=2676739 RepID=UPI0010FFAD77|nr:MULTISPECIES: ABC transporter permease [unclassified Moorella (in: firmicutes)]MDK2894597.1 ral nucleoside transport system permease protein [Moorella sp. (in: firmicutes)]GEA13898.1 ABC transporter permease [Moorella sp. E308F]GEA18730.1 ABC transporter permease [Moorella sp. E306M]